MLLFKMLKLDYFLLWVLSKIYLHFYIAGKLTGIIEIKYFKRKNTTSFKLLIIYRFQGYNLVKQTLPSLHLNEEKSCDG